MTPAQAELLKLCIDADRSVRSRMDANDPHVHYDERGVEVGPFVGISHRTAMSLSALGLIELVSLDRRTCAFLGSYALYDPVED